MNKIRIDHRSETPIYVQIVEQVSDQITSGELLAGDQLPTVRQVAQELRINFNTVSRAYRILDEAGLISTQQGRGTYILEQVTGVARELLQAEMIDEVIESFLVKTIKLGLTTDQVIRLITEYSENKIEREIK
jgi:GntR family transcriptional regulator